MTSAGQAHLAAAQMLQQTALLPELAPPLCRFLQAAGLLGAAASVCYFAAEV